MAKKRRDLTIKMIVDAFCRAEWSTMTMRELYRKFNFQRYPQEWLAVQAYIEKHSDPTCMEHGHPLFRIYTGEKGQRTVRFVGFDAAFWDNNGRS